MMYDELVKRLRECTAEQNGEKTLWHQAADAIEELSQIAMHYEEESKGWWIAACEAKEKIEKLSKQQWIPATERLPEGDANVLLCYEWTGRSGTIYREVGITSIPEIANDPTEMLRPLYWMPLSEPPKEDEE